ncbi:MAG: hypothetical protein LBC18_02080, partial [Opitutaceae bacterium]|nr:hypothetical protein [Opitutaceae bacterium]
GSGMGPPASRLPPRRLSRLLRGIRSEMKWSTGRLSIITSAFEDMSLAFGRIFILLPGWFPSWIFSGFH